MEIESARKEIESARKEIESARKEIESVSTARVSGWIKTSLGAPQSAEAGLLPPPAPANKEPGRDKPLPLQLLSMS